MSEFGDTRSGFPSAWLVYCTMASLLGVLSLSVWVTPGQAALAVFFIIAGLCAYGQSRGTLEGVEVKRLHRERVFEGDPVGVGLTITQSQGFPQSLVLVEDQFLASMSVRQRQLLPMLSRGWSARVHYHKAAERHRGTYFLGPVELSASDPLGLFPRIVPVDCVTLLTVYPRPISLAGYRLLGPRPPLGPTMQNAVRRGMGEEIIGVRPYRPGDPPSRIHWRSSARRGGLHVMEQDAQVQSDVHVFIDLTHHARFGTGAEATTEIAIGCAVSILVEAEAAHLRTGLVWVRDQVTRFAPGSGVTHLQLLLDRLAMISTDGELHFWGEAAPYAGAVASGSRAIFIVPAAVTPVSQAAELVRGLVLRGVAVDVILQDESQMTRIWRNQGPTVKDARERFIALVKSLEMAGARVFPLHRGDNASDLLEAALEER